MHHTILSSELSPFGARLRIACALKGLDYRFELPPGGSGSSELKKLAPFGRIPVLCTEQHVLVESLALLDYLEDAYPDARSMRPSDAVDRARVRMLILLFDHNVVKALSALFAQLMKPVADLDAGRGALDEVATELAKLVQYFDAHGPAIGAQWSMADCAMAPFAFLIDTLSPAFQATSPTQRVPRFAQWWQETSTLAQVSTVTALMQKALAAMMAAKKTQAMGH